MKHRNFKINKHLGHSHRFIHRFWEWDTREDRTN